MSRHSEFTTEIGDAICERIADGLSLRAVCRETGMPTKTTVLKWLGQNEAFAAQYARAREERADVFADEMVEIADTDEDPQRARVRIDARKWAASKLSPKKYGDRLDLNANVNHSFADLNAEADAIRRSRAG